MALTVAENDEENWRYEVIVNSVLSEYETKSIDRAHSTPHIKKVMQNVSDYYPLLDAVTKREFPEKFIRLVALYHDSGLFANKADLAEGVQFIQSIREEHHVSGRDRFWGDYGKGVFVALSFVNQFRAEYGALAILEHRASTKQTTPLSRFIRCCDGINTAEDIIARCVDYVVDHNSPISDYDIGSMCMNHIVEKYTGPTAYSSSLPFDWANDIMVKEIERLRRIVAICADTPETFMHVSRNLHADFVEQK